MKNHVFWAGPLSLVGNGGEFAIKVIIVLTADVCLEVVAGDHKVNLEKDADGVINSCVPGDQL